MHSWPNEIGHKSSSTWDIPVYWFKKYANNLYVYQTYKSGQNYSRRKKRYNIYMTATAVATTTAKKIGTLAYDDDCLWTSIHLFTTDSLESSCKNKSINIYQIIERTTHTHSSICSFIKIGRMRRRQTVQTIFDFVIYDWSQ